LRGSQKTKGEDETREKEGTSLSEKKDSTIFGAQTGPQPEKEKKPEPASKLKKGIKLLKGRLCKPTNAASASPAPKLRVRSGGGTQGGLLRPPPGQGGEGTGH